MDLYALQSIFRDFSFRFRDISLGVFNKNNSFTIHSSAVRGGGGSRYLRKLFERKQERNNIDLSPLITLSLIKTLFYFKEIKLHSISLATVVLITLFRILCLRGTRQKNDACPREQAREKTARVRTDTNLRPAHSKQKKNVLESSQSI